jgi:alpha-ribazole phosphatase
MGANKQLYLVRHGDVGCQGRYIGSSDPALSPLGWQQMRDLAASFRGRPVDAILCSPLRRCRQSLEALAVDAPVRFQDALREVDFGAWEGKSFAEIAACDVQAVAAWAASAANFTFPGGESLALFYERMVALWQSLVAVEGDLLLVVTHGGVIRHLLCLALALPWEKYLLFEISLGSLTSLSLYSHGAVLTSLNCRG